MNPHNSIIILGPTASGKTRLATQLAHVLNGAVLSFDSRQVYRQLNIGSGKDLNEFKIGNHTIPYHLIDIADINENFHSCEFVKNYLEAYETCSLKKELPILCGGTGLYFDLVLKQYQYINIPNNEDLRKQLSVMSDEALLLELNLFPHQAISQADISTRKRIIRAIEIAEYLSKYKHDKISYPNIKPLIIGINLSSSERRKRIDDRLNDRLANGLIEEVENLLKQGIRAERLIYLGLEYRYITEYLAGKYGKTEMIKLLQTAIHQYSKRQMTWFRKMEREGNIIHWLDGKLPIEEQVKLVLTDHDLKRL